MPDISRHDDSIFLHELRVALDVATRQYSEAVSVPLDEAKEAAVAYLTASKAREEHG